MTTISDREIQEADGYPCPACGDTMNLDESNLVPTWSDKHDDIVCLWCAEDHERPTDWTLEITLRRDENDFVTIVDRYGDVITSTLEVCLDLIRMTWNLRTDAPYLRDALDRAVHEPGWIQDADRAEFVHMALRNGHTLEEAETLWADLLRSRV